ncbi:NAD(P)/FAD-dependent oxidoreductase [Hymenobacter algoricola]|uniref:NAD(P)/FAD-dependent oxidoreductase n=1 Tax=Hymenobacter algoricola TaxID=486267 RepID=A0ABP7MUY7_9BACT
MPKIPLPAHSAYEMIVVGASNAGLSAALVLGRARRRVLVLDDGGLPATAALHPHGFFARDGSDPRRALGLGREQLLPYPVEFSAHEARQAKLTPAGIVLTLGSGTVVTTPSLLLATGMSDELPAIPGVAALWGRGVYHCPYCHGWENRYNQVAVYGGGRAGYQQAVLLHHWCPRLTLNTDGPADLTPEQRAHLRALAIVVEEAPVSALDGSAKCLRALELQDGRRQPVDAVFLRPNQRQRSTLAAQLGCAFTPEGGYVQVSETGLTGIPGVYAVGDMTGPFQQAILAAASGTRAAAALNDALILRRSAAA